MMLYTFGSWIWQYINVYYYYNYYYYVSITTRTAKFISLMMPTISLHLSQTSEHEYNNLLTKWSKQTFPVNGGISFTLKRT